MTDRKFLLEAASGAVAAILLLSSNSGYALAQEQSFPGCPLLLEGQSGECVERLQNYLNADNKSYDLPVDRYFGKETRIAVLDFQGRNRLPADGNVGAVTARALIASIENNSVDSPQQQDDVDSSRPSRNRGEGPPPTDNAAEPTARVESGISYNAGRATDSLYFSRSKTREIADQMDADSSSGAWSDGVVAGLGCAKATKNPYLSVACGAIATAPRAFAESTFKNAKLQGQCVQLKWLVLGVTDSPLYVPPAPKASIDSGEYCED